MLRRGVDFRRYVKMLIALIFPGFGPLIIAYAAGEISLSETSGPPVVLVKGIAGLFSDKSSLPIYEKLPGIALTGLAETIYAAVDVVSLSLSYDILVRGNEMRGGAC